MKKLHVLHVALTLGFFGALYMLLMALFAKAGYGQEWISLIASFYKGFDLTSKGMVLGIIYGFIDGFIAGAIFSWIFNWVGTWLKK